MSINSRALLLYGIKAGDKLEDWQAAIAAHKGVNPPTGDFKGNEKEHKDYWKAKDTIIKDFGVTVEKYGTPKQTYYLLGIKDSLFTASREYEEKIDIGYLKYNKEWDAKLKDAAGVLGVKFENVGWWLVNYIEVI